jgi:chromosome segregation ATPase
MDPIERFQDDVISQQPEGLLMANVVRRPTYISQPANNSNDKDEYVAQIQKLVSKLSACENENERLRCEHRSYSNSNISSASSEVFYSETYDSVDAVLNEQDSIINDLRIKNREQQDKIEELENRIKELKNFIKESLTEQFHKIVDFI